MKNFNDIYQKIYQENIHIEENRKVYLLHMILLQVKTMMD